MKQAFILCIVGITLSFVSGSVHAGSVAYGGKSTGQTTVFDPFRKGGTELELSAGYFWPVGSKGTARRPDIEWIAGSARYGWMLNDPSGSGVFRGNWEFLVGAFGDWLYDEETYFVGADLNLRYNFIQPGASVIPFFQIGAGGAYGELATKNKAQGLVGTEWNFELQAALGVRWMLSDQLALTTYAQWQHFSNAGNSGRNRGLNGIGAMAGLSWFF